jgi:hypothetical protein
MSWNISFVAIFIIKVKINKGLMKWSKKERKKEKVKTFKISLV